MKFSNPPILSKNFFPNLTSGVLIGAMEVVFVISLVSLIFSGGLETYLPLGVNLGLLSAGIVFISIAIISSQSDIFATVQDVTATLLAVIIALIIVDLPQDQVLPTVLAALAVCTLATSIAFLLTGVFRLANLIRYIPFPVTGGFLAATGWLLFTGGLAATTGINPTWSNSGAYFQAEVLILWIPGLLIAILFFLATRRIRNPLAVPAILVGTVAIFYIILAILDIPLSRASQLGLLTQMQNPPPWRPLTPQILGAANWGAILGQSGNILTLVGLAVIGLLLNLSALELDKDREFNLNRELRSAGITNLLTGLAGGLIGYHAVSVTSLGKHVGGRGRLPGIIAGLICLLALFAGSSILKFIPQPLIGGVLLFLGIDFLETWLIRSWKRFSPLEYAIILMIFAIIIFTNFILGVLAGMLVMILIFVVNYSGTNVSRLALTGADIHSKVVRSSSQNQILAEHGSRIYILALQGFLFFGTANKLWEQVKTYLNNPSTGQVSFLLLDFNMVTGMDSSAALSFEKIARLAQKKQVKLVMTAIPGNLKARLSAVIPGLASAELLSFSDLDHGLEWCENQLLSQLMPGEEANGPGVRDLFLSKGLSEAQTDRLLAYMEPLTFQAGDVLYQAGNPAEDLYYIIWGRISVYEELPDRTLTRLSTLDPGTSVGEMGIYLKSVRSADVIADQSTQVLRLTSESLRRMEEAEPDLAAAFHAMTARQLAGWVLQANRSLKALRGYE